MKNAKLSQPNGLPLTLIMHRGQLIHRALSHRTPQMEHSVDTSLCSAECSHVTTGLGIRIE